MCSILGRRYILHYHFENGYKKTIVFLAFIRTLLLTRIYCYYFLIFNSRGVRVVPCCAGFSKGLRENVYDVKNKIS